MRGKGVYGHNAMRYVCLNVTAPLFGAFSHAGDDDDALDCVNRALALDVLSPILRSIGSFL